MTDKHTRVIEISSDTENAVESFLHTIKNVADEGGRYGVEIEINRVEVKEGQEVSGFE